MREFMERWFIRTGKQGEPELSSRKMQEGEKEKKKTGLTKREREVYDYVVSFWDEMHVSPSMREIASGMGLSSASTVHKHIHSLIEKGWLLPHAGRMRCMIPNEERRK